MKYLFKEKIILVNIIFYGNAGAGKRTLMRSVLSNFNDASFSGHEGGFIIKGYEWVMKFLFNATTPVDIRERPEVFEIVDALVFVVDCQKSLLEDTKIAWSLLKRFYGAKLYEIPVIVAINKQDLQKVKKVRERTLGIEKGKFRHFSVIHTIAVRNWNTTPLSMNLWSYALAGSDSPGVKEYKRVVLENMKKKNGKLNKRKIYSVNINY